MKMPRSGTMTNLRVNATASTTATFKIAKNGSTTGAPTCTISAATSCEDTSTTLAIAANDTISVEISGVSGGKPVRFTVELQ